MVTVTISINERTIFARSARRVEEGKDDAPNTYLVDDGRRILHHSNDGVLTLAKTMLEGITEP